MSNLRVLTVSKPYVSSAYRSKWVHLQKNSSLEVGLIVPPSWAGQKYEPNEDDSLYYIKQIPIYLDGKNHFHFYNPSLLKKAILEFSPHVLNIEEEHYSIVTYQCYRLAKKMGIPSTFYTWQNLHKKYPPPFSWIEKYIFANTRIAIAGNQEAGDILVQKGFNHTWEKIPQMGVDYELFHSKHLSFDEKKSDKALLGLDPEKIYIGFAGRIVEEKGLQDLLEAVNILEDSLRDKIQVCIVGEGPYLQDLKNLSSKLGIETIIEFVGSVSSTEVPKYLRAFDIMTLPSLTRNNWKEQFGRILVEAMAAGSIVIGSDSGEIPIVIGDCGFVFQEANPKELKKAIEKALNPKLDQIALRKSAQTRALENFSKGVIAEKFATVFRQLANNT